MLLQSHSNENSVLLDRTHTRTDQWKGRENLEIYLHIFGQCIAKEPRIYRRESTVSSVNGGGMTSLVRPVVKDPPANAGVMVQEDHTCRGATSEAWTADPMLHKRIHCNEKPTLHN